MPMLVDTFTATVKRRLKIRRPVRLTIYQGDSTPEGYDGAHTFENGSHHVEVATFPSRGFYTTLAHELIHAALEEQAPRSKWHGFAFQRRAADLENYLQSQGWPVKKIFWLGVDK